MKLTSGKLLPLMDPACGRDTAKRKFKVRPAPQAWAIQLLDFPIEERLSQRHVDATAFHPLDHAKQAVERAPLIPAVQRHRLSRRVRVLHESLAEPRLALSVAIDNGEYPIRGLSETPVTASGPDSSLRRD